MNPKRPARDSGSFAFPHTRGDEPPPSASCTACRSFPHTRGDEPNKSILQLQSWLVYSRFNGYWFFCIFHFICPLIIRPILGYRPNTFVPNSVAIMAQNSIISSSLSPSVRISKISITNEGVGLIDVDIVMQLPTATAFLSLSSAIWTLATTLCKAACSAPLLPCGQRSSQTIELPYQTT